MQTQKPILRPQQRSYKIYTPNLFLLIRHNMIHLELWTYQIVVFPAFLAANSPRKNAWRTFIWPFQWKFRSYVQFNRAISRARREEQALGAPRKRLQTLTGVSEWAKNPDYKYVLPSEESRV